MDAKSECNLVATDSKHWHWPKIGGCGMHYGCDFKHHEEEISEHLKLICRKRVIILQCTDKIPSSNRVSLAGIPP